MSIPDNVIACQIKYGAVTVRCDLHGKRELNLNGASSMLVKKLNELNQNIPQSLSDFMDGDGLVTYYRSY